MLVIRSGPDMGPGCCSPPHGVLVESVERVRLTQLTPGKVLHDGEKCSAMDSKGTHAHTFSANDSAPEPK